MQPIIARLHGVVAQIFFDRRIVVFNARLLHAITIHRVVGMGFDELVERRDVVFVALGMREHAIGPFQSIVIIDAKEGRFHCHALVGGLRYVVETRIIHDGRCGAILLCEGSRPQRIGWKCGRSSHVMGEAERVTHFVCDDILERRGHQTVRHGRGTCCRVALCRLHKAPVVNGVHHIVVDQYGGRDNLARARINPGRSHSVLHCHRQIANARIFKVIGIE